jgi:multiple sugar transport system permease protein
MDGARSSARSRLAVYAMLIVLAVPFFFPLFWLITGSLKDPSALLQIPPVWWPSHWTTRNFHVLFHSGNVDLLRYASNTLIMCGTWVVPGTFVSALVAYGFARIDFPGRSFLFATVIVVLILPVWATIAPQYLLFKSVGWLGTLAPVTVPAFAGVPFSIFLLREFMRGIPAELTDAARIDGANEFGIFWRVILPQLKPVLAVTALFTFVDTYNSFFLPLVYLTSEKNYTLALGAYQFIQLHGAPDTGTIIAHTVLLSAPLLLVFVVIQRRLTAGVRISGRMGR